MGRRPGRQHPRARRVPEAPPHLGDLLRRRVLDRGSLRRSRRRQGRVRERLRVSPGPRRSRWPRSSRREPHAQPRDPPRGSGRAYRRSRAPREPAEPRSLPHQRAPPLPRAGRRLGLVRGGHRRRRSLPRSHGRPHRVGHRWQGLGRIAPLPWPARHLRVRARRSRRLAAHEALGGRRALRRLHRERRSRHRAPSRSRRPCRLDLRPRRGAGDDPAARGARVRLRGAGAALLRSRRPSSRGRCLRRASLGSVDGAHR